MAPIIMEAPMINPNQVKEERAATMPLPTTTPQPTTIMTTTTMMPEMLPATTMAQFEFSRIVGMLPVNQERVARAATMPLPTTTSQPTTTIMTSSQQQRQQQVNHA